MVNLRRLTDQAKKIVNKRGGTGALKEDADELKDIATGKGSLKEKAKAADLSALVEKLEAQLAELGS